MSAPFLFRPAPEGCEPTKFRFQAKIEAKVITKEVKPYLFELVSQHLNRLQKYYTLKVTHTIIALLKGLEYTLNILYNAQENNNNWELRSPFP